MAISPSAVPDLISMEMVSSLSGSCACFQVPLRCLSDPVDQSGCEGGGRQDKVVSLIFFFFTSFRDFSVRLLFPAHAAEGLPFILEILFLSPPCVVPHFLFLVPCRKRGGFHSIPFLLFCRASWHPPSCLGLMEIKKKKKKKEKREKKRRESKAKRGQRGPPFPSLLCLRSHQLKQAHEGETSEWQRCMRSSPLLSLALPPSPSPLYLSLCVCVSPSLSLSLSLVPFRFPLCVRASPLHTGAGCSVVTGEMALRVQRHLWMCLCWGGLK